MDLAQGEGGLGGELKIGSSRKVLFPFDLKIGF